MIFKAKTEKGSQGSLAILLANRRMVLKKTQKDVAKVAGVSEYTIGHLESGSTVSIAESSVLAFAEAYQLDEKDLLPYAVKRLIGKSRNYFDQNIMCFVRIIAGSNLSSITLKEFNALLRVKRSLACSLDENVVTSLVEAIRRKKL